MKQLESIVLNLLSEYKGGEVYFDKLDETLRETEQLPIILELFKPLVGKNVIVSGKFGFYLLTLYNQKLINVNSIIYVNGGLRDGNIKQSIIKNFLLTPSEYIFVDDSFYLGRTQQKISQFLERLNHTLSATHVVYDGSVILNENVKSLFRYHK